MRLRFPTCMAGGAGAVMGAQRYNGRPRVSLGFNLSLNKLPVAVVVIIALIVVALIIYLLMSPPAPSVPTAPAAAAGANASSAAASTPAATGTGDSPAAEAPININTADAEALQGLPNIGEVRAQAIIEHRERYGPFASIEDIQDVKGIGPEIFAQLRRLNVRDKAPPGLDALSTTVASGNGYSYTVAGEELKISNGEEGAEKPVTLSLYDYTNVGGEALGL
ncbi:MAG: ComEA family DNA-binding protein, partial [Coriobacteriales bacterium]|nr:ComEA family DNA-binding protein [Coriobacteriales bacterium]